MDTTDFTDYLQGLLDGEFVAEEAFPGVRTRTFRDSGVMTSNDGLVVRCSDGREFQVTVVQSR